MDERFEDYQYDSTLGTIAVGDRVYDDHQLSKQQEVLLQESESASKESTYIPEAVRDFILYFQKCFYEGKVNELNSCYESSFSKLTEKFYKNSPWPHPEQVVAPLVNHDETFLLYYKEVYFRHLYSRLTPTLEQRFDSYNNYCALFNLIVNSDGPSNIELPMYWAWDIIDEFIYQFNSYSMYRTRAIKKGLTQEIETMEQNPGMWSAFSVLNVLYSLTIKAKMTEQLKAMKQGQDAELVAGEYGSKPLYKMLGYFAIIGTLRVHTLLGDFTLALKTMENMDLSKKALLARVAAAHFTTYYYVGFCYLMLGRYADAIKAFSHILLFISRTKNINRSAQFRIVSKKSEQMYALLAICVTLCPTRLDDIVHVGLREKYGEQLAKISRSIKDTAANSILADDPTIIKIFEELFLFAAPKFISPSLPDYEHPAMNIDPLQHHSKIFLATVANATLGAKLKPYLNLYATMELSKLSAFLEADDEFLRSALVCYKLKTRQIKWTEGDLLNGESGNVSEINIALENDLIHISETKVSRKFADFFIRNIGKNYMVQEFIANPVENNSIAGKQRGRKY